MRLALLLCLVQVLIAGCGCGKSQSDRPMPVEKLKAYIPASIPHFVKKNAVKHDSEKDDFTVVFADFQNEKYDTLHLEIRDHAEDSFAERFHANTDKKWRKITYRSREGRELIVTPSPGTNPAAATGKQAIEVVLGTRFFVSAYTDDEKSRAVLVKSAREVLDAVDFTALEAGKAPTVQPVATNPYTASAPSGSSPAASGSPSAGAAVTVDAGDCPPLPTRPPHPVGKPNPLATRIDFTLIKDEDEETAAYAEICKLEKQLKSSGPMGNRGIAASLDAKKKKFAELEEKIKDARKALLEAYRNPPKDPNAPPPPPPPTKPPEPTLHEKWMAKVEPMLKAGGKAQDALNELQALPLSEKQSIDYHSALARAYRELKQQNNAAEALLMLSLLLNDPKPEAKRTEVAPVRAWLKKQTDKEMMIAMIGAKSAKPADRVLAVKAYLAAVKLDSAVLERDDKGLRELSLKALRQLVDKHPDRTDLLFLLGVYSEKLGESVTATSSFRSYVAKEPDPYLKWRAQAYLNKIAPGN